MFEIKNNLYTTSQHTELPFPHILLITASAGSGKTHTLTRRYVQFLLSENIPNNHLRNIVAITFTNNAATEMKQRVLELLKKISLHDEKLVEWRLAAPSDATGISKDGASAPQKKSAVLLQEIFDNYSDFQIKTIDSFMTTIFKSSSLEFGYTPDFTVLLSADALLDEAFEKFAREAMQNTQLRQLLDGIVRIIAENSTDKEKYLWDPYTLIRKEVKNLYKTLAHYAAPLNDEDVASILEETRKELRTHAASFKKYLESTSLPLSKIFQNDLDDVVNGNIMAIMERTTKEKIVNKPKKSEEGIAAQHQQRIDEGLQRFYYLLSEYALTYSKNYYRPYVKTSVHLRAKLDEIQRQRGEVVIDVVNKELASYLRKEVVPEVYVKLGDTLFHFFVDEFQDTNPMQWKNLFPLIENALSSSGSLFVVGDMKQSIYGFRGADWQIMKNLKKENPFPSAQLLVDELPTNYRSHEKIVQFNREVFSHKVAEQNLQHAAEESELYNFTQEVKEEFCGKGYVEVSVVEQAEEPQEREKIIEIIRNCTARGYSLGDICILTRRNNDVVNVSSWLNNEKIEFISHSNLDIRRRTIVGTLIAFLRFLDSPIDSLSFATFISSELFLHSVDRVSRDDIQSFLFSHRKISGTLYRSFERRFPELWKKYFHELFTLVGYLPLYDLLSETYKLFRVFELFPNEEATLVKLLDCVNGFEEEGNNNLKDFLLFADDEDDERWKVDAPASTNAVTVMTIHKAKGLGFPVVINLFYDSPAKSNNIFVAESENGITLLHITKKLAEKNIALGECYDNMKFKSDVEMLNTLYVALTRAREELYVVSVFKKERKLPSLLFPDEMYPAAKKENVTQQKVLHVPTLRPYHHTNRAPLPMQRPAKLGIVEIQRGDLIHQILALIEWYEPSVDENITRAIEKYFSSSMIAFTKNDMKRIILEFLSAPCIQQYFAKKVGRTLLREQDFANASGQLFRMDRILVEDDVVTVIDFKTGSDDDEKKYREQISNYKNIVHELFPKQTVAGVLLYVDLKIARSV